MEASRRYWEIVMKLVDRGITTSDMWRLLEPDLFNQVVSRREYGFKIKNILSDVCKNISWSRSALEYMLLNKIEGDIILNPLYQLCLLNDFDPIKVASYITCWASCSEIQRVRNVFWISGNVKSCARVLYDAIAGSVPLVKSANWHDCENPFLRCMKSLIIMWDNGKISGSHASIVYRVFKGQYVCIGARKPYLKFEIIPKPVLLWGEDDIFHIHHNDFVDSSMVSEFEANTFKLHLKADASSTVKFISIDDVHEFVQWGHNNLSDLNENMIVQD